MIASRCINKTYGVDVSGHFIGIIFLGGLVIAFASFVSAFHRQRPRGGLAPLPQESSLNFREAGAGMQVGMSVGVPMPE